MEAMSSRCGPLAQHFGGGWHASLLIVRVMQEKHFVEAICDRKRHEKIIMGLRGKVDHEMGTECGLRCDVVQLPYGFHDPIDGIPAVHELKDSL